MSEEIEELEAMPTRDARRIITRAYLAGIVVYLLGSCAVLLSLGWIIAMLTDNRPYVAWWTPLIAVPALLITGGMLGWWLRGRIRRRTGTQVTRR